MDLRVKAQDEACSRSLYTPPLKQIAIRNRGIIGDLGNSSYDEY